ncbi:hypothetical protein PLANPX_5600 [Lacipirellula parvula]|uniref:Uncharacterized protein n=1 Tax=Lacipirellula parvula TaxID=2650471 RepID=A0A5K7XHQ8_9BACT|nr:hypothetical protein PLANPX_5600 [Lacipirellula parvula]
MSPISRRSQPAAVTPVAAGQRPAGAERCNISECYNFPNEQKN